MLRVGNLMGPSKKLAGGAAPTPSLDGLEAWFIYDTEIYQDTGFTTPSGTGDPVQGWKDQSGNDNHLTYDTGDGVSNGFTKGASAINLSSFNYAFASSMTFTECETFIVGKINGDVNFLRGSIAGDSVQITTGGSDFQSFPVRSDLSADGGDVANASITPDVKTIFNSQLEDQLNSVAVNGGSAVDVVIPTGNQFIWIYFGYPTYDVTGSELYEVIIYGRKLTAPERATVLAYLNAKYLVF